MSWNTQGASVGRITLAQRDLFMSKDAKTGDDIKNIILVQEAGTDNIPESGKIGEQKFGRRQFYSFFAEQPGADNKRCTTGIFAEKDIINPTMTQFAAIASGQPRPVVTLQINFYAKSFILATVHATAYQPIAKGEIRYIFNTLNDSKKEWILIGDFNCTPDILIKEGVPEEQMACTKEPTHKAGKILDYAVFSKGFAGKIQIHRGLPGNPGFVPVDSDHYPIYFQVVL